MYYAKPVQGYKGSYEYHVKRCIEIFYFEFEGKKTSLRRILERIGWELEQFKLDMYIAVAMHDFGKLSEVFQEQMQCKIDSRKPKNYFRHELLSTAYTILVNQDGRKNWEREFPFVYYIILSHHKRLNPLLSDFNREFNNDVWPKLTEDKYYFGTNLVVENCYKNLQLEKYREFTLYSHSIRAVIEKNMSVSYFNMLVNKQGFTRRNIRILYSIAKGFLQYCDWVGSSDNEALEQNLSQGALKDRIKDKVTADGNVYEERKFHTDCARATEDAVVIAPTGSGKTEASLLWATNREKSNIIFLMPTMVTSNSIFNRISNSYFDKKICGLTHSSSDVYFALDDERASYDSQKIRFELLKNKVFIPPVMVATIDQMLTCGFNIGHWSLKEYALVGSSVVFDEIQAYDTFTLALMTETIKKIKFLDGRVMIMSATMPKFLEDHFKETLNIKETIVASELMDRRRNNWRFVDKSIDEMDEDIKNYFNSFKRVALIVNDIKTAKRMYEKYSKVCLKNNSEESAVLCLHSEFTMMDRMKKEASLENENDYKLVISTQVMEVSLDISFNVIFSECAPIDSLVQRAGRCNRKGEYKDSEFIVFDYSEVSEKYVYKTKDNILKKTKDVLHRMQGYLSEYEIASMVNEVYKDFNIYDEEYEKGKNLYQMVENETVIFDLNYDEDKFKTRLIENIKTSIIPYVFKDEVEELFLKKEYAKIKLYEVPVSMANFKKYIIHNYCENIYNLPIYTINYSNKTGVLFDDDTFKMY